MLLLRGRRGNRRDAWGVWLRFTLRGTLPSAAAASATIPSSSDASALRRCAGDATGEASCAPGGGTSSDVKKSERTKTGCGAATEARAGMGCNGKAARRIPPSSLRPLLQQLALLKLLRGGASGGKRDTGDVTLLEHAVVLLLAGLGITGEGVFNVCSSPAL